jgi:hypothetical protein
MYKRLLVVLVISLFLGSLSSSCIIHAPRHGHKKQAVKKSKKCKPSHYWDGKKCRHKGKGKGARKHDY